MFQLNSHSLYIDKSTFHRFVIFSITFFVKVIDANGNGWYHKFMKIMSNNDELIER